MFLDESTFKKVISSAPLISIDILVKNSKNQYLLGLRNNRPAQGYWFVPGGRVRKGESLDSAFVRLTKEELGVIIERSDGQFLGPYEHFYGDYVFGEEHSTHYIVLAYTLRLDIALSTLPNSQHCEYRWFSHEEVSKRDDVHVHTKWYLD
jgi:colanic acid biosynthesis protein WcaH